MLLKKSFQFSSDSRPADSSSLHEFMNDRLEISLTRDEFLTLSICLSRLASVEPEFDFYRVYSRSLVRDLCSFEK